MVVFLSTGPAAEVEAMTDVTAEARVTPGHHWEEAGRVRAEEVMALARSPVVEEMPVEVKMVLVR